MKPWWDTRLARAMSYTHHIGVPLAKALMPQMPKRPANDPPVEHWGWTQ
jgi:hypothetical protein